MKKIVFILVLAIGVMSLSSCRKSGVSLFVGEYSFKTSGEVSLTAQAVIDSNNVVIPAVLNSSITNEIGQLNISPTDNDDEVIVVINHMNGDVVTTFGTCDKNTITLEEYHRNTLPLSVNLMFSTGSTYLTVEASGTMYEGNLIVFDVTLNGRGNIGSVTYKIKDKNIQMVAYRN